MKSRLSLRWDTVSLSPPLPALFPVQVCSWPEERSSSCLERPQSLQQGRTNYWIIPSWKEMLSLLISIEGSKKSRLWPQQRSACGFMLNNVLNSPSENSCIAAKRWKKIRTPPNESSCHEFLKVSPLPGPEAATSSAQLTGLRAKPTCLFLGCIFCSSILVPWFTSWTGQNWPCSEEAALP